MRLLHHSDVLLLGLGVSYDLDWGEFGERDPEEWSWLVPPMGNVLKSGGSMSMLSSESRSISVANVGFRLVCIWSSDESITLDGVFWILDIKGIGDVICMKSKRGCLKPLVLP